MGVANDLPEVFILIDGLITCTLGSLCDGGANKYVNPFLERNKQKTQLLKQTGLNIKIQNVYNMCSAQFNHAETDSALQ